MIDIDHVIVEALKTFPALTPNGLGVAFPDRDWNHHEIESAMTFLDLCGHAPKPTVGSYTLKHMVEDWGGQCAGCPYVSNGAVIVAAHALGFPIKPYGGGNPNAGIGVKLRSLKKFTKQFGWWWA
jgi:hypothetical protein